MNYYHSRYIVCQNITTCSLDQLYLIVHQYLQTLPASIVSHKSLNLKCNNLSLLSRLPFKLDLEMVFVPLR